MESLGPLGVFLLMIPESACLPVPSEVTLMSAGFGVHQGWLSFPMAVAAATAGNLVGSLIAYSFGRSGAFARTVRRRKPSVVSCERLFANKGEHAVFFARLLPLARSFVSLPAGHARVPLARFIGLTTAGCAIWSIAFVLSGMLAGAGWKTIAHSVSQAGLILGFGALAGLLLVSARRRTRSSR